MKKINTYHNNLEKSSKTKTNKHTPSLFTHYSFDTTKNKFDYHGSKNCMKNFGLDLREHATKIMKKKEMIPLTKKEEKMHNKQKVGHICKKRFSTDDGKKSTLK